MLTDTNLRSAVAAGISREGDIQHTEQTAV
jgi:hypothetical protein